MAEASRSATFVVMIADCPIPPAACDVRVTTPRLELPRLARGEFAPDERPHVFVPARQLAENPPAWDAYSGRITVVAEPSSGGLLRELRDPLRQLGASCLFTPSAAGDGTVVKEMASFGVPILLACDEDWPAEVLDELLAFFLHSPTLEVPLEPFYSLAAAIAGHRSVNLWQFCDEVPGRNYFVDSQRRVSLSRRWAQRERFFGTAGDDPARFSETALWREVADLKHRLFASQAPCAFCEHYLYCGGFWTTAVNADAACVTWRRLMDRLAAAYRHELDRLQAEYDQEHPAEHLM